MFQAVDPKWRGAPLGNGTGEGLGLSVLHWLLQVFGHLRYQESKQSPALFNAWLWAYSGFGCCSEVLMVCNLAFPISRLSELPPASFLKKENAFECVN